MEKVEMMDLIIHGYDQEESTRTKIKHIVDVVTEKNNLSRGVVWNKLYELFNVNKKQIKRLYPKDSILKHISEAKLEQMFNFCYKKLIDI
jgi:hypothetical protein